MENTQHDIEQAPVKTFEVKEVEVQEVKFPTKGEIDKAYKTVKANLPFTHKDVKAIKAGLSFLEPSLQAADESTKPLVIKNVEMIIENSHSSFLREFRQFKKSEQGISNTFISDFITHCEMKLEEVIQSAQSSNEERQIQVVKQAKEAFDRAELTKEDLILVRHVLAMSVTKKAALIKDLTSIK
ncbi:hypothetical protein C4G69_RS01080 [Vibrio parahaemolyticus]|nr:hypothetical protein [Vibrio parahaemolyticus]EJG1033899.1 hypothetical protein [Vibrio parahaemolyticus]